MFGGNSLLDLVVFEAAAGRHINQNAKESSSLNISKSNIEESLNVFNKIQNSKKGETVFNLRSEMQNVNAKLLWCI